MFGVFGFLVGSGAMNEVEENASPLVTLGWGEWHGVEWIVLLGWTIRQLTTGALDYRVMDGRLHYPVHDGRLHYGCEDGKLHYVL